MTQRITGYHKARLEACPGRFFLACIIVIMTITMLFAAALVPAGIHRQAEWHFRETRV